MNVSAQSAETRSKSRKYQIWRNKLCYAWSHPCCIETETYRDWQYTSAM